MIAELVLGLGVAFAFVLSRMAAFVAVSPVPGSWVPARVRVGLALLLALSAMPVVPASRVPLGPALVAPLFGEVVVGVAVGLVFRIVLAAADLLGAQAAQAMGLTFAAVYDPTQASTVDPLTRLVTLLATVLALRVGAHRVVLGGLLASVQAVPVGAAPNAAAMGPELLDLLAGSVACGLGLALPVVAVCLAVQLAVALVSRAAPSLQIFSVGLAVTLGGGLVVLLAGAEDALAGLAAQLGTLASAIERTLGAGT